MSRIMIGPHNGKSLEGIRHVDSGLIIAHKPELLTNAWESKGFPELSYDDRGWEADDTDWDMGLIFDQLDDPPEEPARMPEDVCVDVMHPSLASTVKFEVSSIPRFPDLFDQTGKTGGMQTDESNDENLKGNYKQTGYTCSKEKQELRMQQQFGDDGRHVLSDAYRRKQVPLLQQQFGEDGRQMSGELVRLLAKDGSPIPLLQQQFGEDVRKMNGKQLIPDLPQLGYDGRQMSDAYKRRQQQFGYNGGQMSDACQGKQLCIEHFKEDVGQRSDESERKQVPLLPQQTEVDPRKEIDACQGKQASPNLQQFGYDGREMSDACQGKQLCIEHFKEDVGQRSDENERKEVPLLPQMEVDARKMRGARQRNQVSPNLQQFGFDGREMSDAYKRRQQQFGYNGGRMSDACQGKQLSIENFKEDVGQRSDACKEKQLPLLQQQFGEGGTKMSDLYEGNQVLLPQSEEDDRQMSDALRDKQVPLLQQQYAEDGRQISGTCQGKQLLQQQFAEDNSRQTSGMLNEKEMFLGKREQFEEDPDDKAAIVPIAHALTQSPRPSASGHSTCNKTFENQQTISDMDMKMDSSHSTSNDNVIEQGTVPLLSASKSGHNKRPRIKCPICGVTLAGPYELERHKGRKHSQGEKEHACEKCEKKFHVEVDLRDHKKICGVPFDCKSCSTTFAYKCNYVTHLKNHPECKETPDIDQGLDDGSD